MGTGSGQAGVPPGRPADHTCAETMLARPPPGLEETGRSREQPPVPREGLPDQLSAGGTAWIFDDPDGMRQRAVQACGLEVTFVGRVFNLLGERARQILLNLSAEKPALLWCNLLTAGTPRGDRKDRQAASLTASLARTQRDLGGLLLIDGQSENKAVAWGMLEMQQLIQEPGFHVARLAWCRLGVFDRGSRG